MNGKLIVIEGSDGSGKATQSRLLLRRLRREKVPCAGIAFPGYHRGFFGAMVGRYLRGEFGPSAHIDPHLAALLYAGDRWEARERMARWLREGRVIVCDRYVDSNKAHQSARLADPKAAAEFMEWVDRLEHRVYKLPRPDFTLFLRVPEKMADDLIGRKGRRAYLRGVKRDIHESDSTHQRRAQEGYLALARKRPASKGALIECVAGGQLLSRTEIAEQVWRKVRRVLARRGR